MDSITITDTGSYRWRLEAVNPVGTVTWGRDVTGTQTILGTGDAITDTPPFNLPVTYFATDDIDTEVAAPVTYTSTVPVLSSQTTSQAVPILVLSQDRLEYEARSRTHQVIGRADPLVTILPPVYPGGELVLWAANLTHRQELEQLLGTGSTLVLRSTRQDTVRDMTLLPTSWTDELVNADRPAGPRVYRIDYQAVTTQASYGPPATRQYLTWPVEAATWDDLLALHATWNAARDSA